jgi:uncharacterized protein (TIGR03435 family)
MTVERTNRGDDPIAASWSSPTPDQIDAARTRVRNRLQSVAILSEKALDLPPEGGSHEQSRLSWRWQRAAWALAAVVVFAAATFTGRLVPVAHDGELVRSGARPREMTLADGSRVEMRPQTELSLERADDGIGINLGSGSIIVNAAKQHGGHLYVRTKDMTVSVVGTVFVVNASEEGSRVGVIEGEVRVREQRRDQKVETSLYPGQQVSTSARRVLPPLKDDIAWSRHADVHRAILDAFMNGMAASSTPLAPLKELPRAFQAQDAPSAVVAAAGPSFDEASVRECDPDNLPPSPVGARGGGANSLLMTPGHLYAQCMTLATLIRTALNYGPVELEFMGGGRGGGQRAGRGMRFDAVYGLGVEDGQRVRGGQDWIRNARYTIEAVGDGQASAEMMRGPMLLNLLERRFQLKTHIESEQMPGYALVVGPGGLKPLKPFRESDCAPTSDAVKAERERKGWTGPMLITEAAYFGVKPNCGGVSGETNGPNYHFEVANSTVGMVAGFAGSSMGVRVIDRTNITDRFTYTWDFGIDEVTPLAMEDLQRGKTWNPKPGWDSPMTIPKAPSIFQAVEQLGLKLEPIRVPREFIVIDRVERPSPN